MKAYYWHATASMSMDPWTGWVFFQIFPLLYLHIFFYSPRFFRLSQCCLEQWQRARAELCDSLPPSLPLSSNPFRNKQCKHISKAIHYILAQLKDSSTGLLADRQAKRNILQAPNWGNEILLVHSLWTKPDTLSLVLNWHQHATYQTAQLIQSWASL